MIDKLLSRAKQAVELLGAVLVCWLIYRLIQMTIAINAGIGAAK